jgi:BASS family bile acid:Na+ symporter
LIRAFGLLAALAIGAACPSLSAYSCAIRPLLMLLLGVAFLGLPPRPAKPQSSQAALWGVSLALGTAFFAALRPFDHELATIALLLAFLPTATAAPVVTGFLGGEASYVAIMVLGTNLVQPILLALLAPHLAQGAHASGLAPVVASTLATIGIPFAIAKGAQSFLPAKNAERLRQLRHLSFPLWLLILALAVASSVDFLEHQHSQGTKIASIAGISLLLCALQFSLGRRIGGVRHAIEASQSLGQKNTMIGIWFATAHLSPTIALGPAFYVLWHNLWNAWQLQRPRKPMAPNGAPVGTEDSEKRDPEPSP